LPDEDRLMKAEKTPTAIPALMIGKAS